MRERVVPRVVVLLFLGIGSCVAVAAPGGEQAGAPAAAAAPAAMVSGAVRLLAGQEDWKQAAPPMPPTARVALIEGDPTKAGTFTMRVKLPAGFALPPHTHTTTERTTVISGAVWVGLGIQADKQHAQRLVAGSFYLNPKDAPHFLFTDEEAVLQVTAEGPWETHLAPPPEGAR